MHIVLGAPGSGKSTIVPTVKTLLADKIVLDWDVLMQPAGALAQVHIPRTPEAWPRYSELMRMVVEAVGADRVLLFGVQTPDEMVGWPEAAWLLLDCDDAERQRRLTKRGESVEGISDALVDAAAYRALGLVTIDTSRLTPEEVAERVAGWVLR